MVDYSPLWDTMQKRKSTQYTPVSYTHLASETANFLHTVPPVPGCCHLCQPDTGSGKEDTA